MKPTKKLIDTNIDNNILSKIPIFYNKSQTKKQKNTSKQIISP